jgi:hypothetical protein
VGVLSLSKLDRIEPKGGTRSTYEKRAPAGSKAAPCCLQCKAPFDLAELSMVDQMDALDGVGLCADCLEANFLKENHT